MKRLAAIMMTVSMMAAALTGCGASEDNLSSIDLEKYVTSLGEYKGLELSAAKTEVTDEYIESYIDYMLMNYPELVEVTDRAVALGDVVNIDYVGKKDGVAFEGGTAQGYELAIGSGTFIEGFEDGLVGANKGDVVDLNLTFPEEYHSEELAGADVVFTVTVNSINEQKTPELTDEFVKQFECETVDEFRESVKISLEDSANATYTNELQTQVIDILTANCEFSDELPEELYNYYKGQITANFENYATQYGVDLETFVTSYYGTTMDEFNAQIEDGAASSTRQAMACALIAQKEGIEVTDEELNTKIEENYANFVYESVDAYKEAENEEDYRDYLLTGKVLNFLVENAVVTEPVLDTETVTETVETEAASEVTETVEAAE